MHIPWMSDSARRANAAQLAKRRRRMVAVGGVLLSLCSLALWGNSEQPGPVTQLLAYALRPMVRFEDLTVRTLTGGSGRFQDLWRTASRLAEARERNLVLEAAIAERELIHAENRFLRESLEMINSLDLRALPARVIGRNEMGTQSVVIDLGEKDGVRPFDPVLQPEGAVGYVARTLDHASLVLLVTDRNARLGVSVIVDASKETVEGRTRGLPDGAHLLLQTKTPQPISADSQVVTSSVSTIFPAGVPVGRVETGIQSPGGLLDEYVVEPAVNLREADWGLVLTGTRRGEALELFDATPSAREDAFR